MSDLEPRQSTLPCIVLGCESLRLARGLCYRHYARWMRTDDVYTRRERRENPNLPPPPAYEGD